MKFSRRRWLTLIATDLILRVLTYFFVFFFGPIFSCLHLVLLALASKLVSRFDLPPALAFVTTMIITNVPFFAVDYWITLLIFGPSGPNGYTLGFMYFQVVFNVLLVLTFWLDQRFGGDAVPTAMRDLK